MIERNIFQTWKSKSQFPANFAYWSATIKALNPQFRYVLWDDADNRAFIEANYRWFLPTYDAYPKEIYRADAVRYFWLYHFGGIYIDMDSECVKPLDELLESRTGVVLGRMGSDPTFRHSIPNAVMASSSREPFWVYVFHRLMAYADDKNITPEDKTGPILLKNAVDSYLDVREAGAVKSAIADVCARLPPELQPKPGPSPIELLDPRYFYPVNWSDPIHLKYFHEPIIQASKMLSKDEVRALFSNSYIVSYWSHSWEELHPSLARILARKVRSRLNRYRSKLSLAKS